MRLTPGAANPSPPASGAPTHPAPPPPGVEEAGPAPAEADGGRGGRARDDGRGPGLVLLAAALTVGAVLRVALAVGDDSVYWPDEVHKTLEPAHRLVFGYGLQAWELARGAVSWALPAALAGVLEGLALVGLDDPRGYLVALRLVFAGLSLLAAYGSYVLARAHGAPTMAAALAGVLFALVAPALYFSHRLLSESASLVPVTFGLALGLRPSPRRWQVAAGAGLLGLAVFLRLQNGIFCLGLLAALAARRDRRALRDAAVVLAVAAGLFGLLDRLTWGGWFHSAVEYARFNLAGEGASRFGRAPFGYYGDFLLRSLGPAAVPVAALVACSFTRARALFLTTAAFVLAHSLQPHKEARFLLPALPLLCALAGVGVAVVAGSAAGSRARGRVRVAVVGAATAAAALSAARLPALTYGEVGQGRLFDRRASAYFHGSAVNRLLLAAHDRGDLCGIHVEVEVRVWTGGYSYLHRRVPLYGKDTPPPPGSYNYAIAVGGRAGQHVVARAGGLVLDRLGPGPCTPDPGFSDHLF